MKLQLISSCLLGNLHRTVSYLALGKIAIVVLPAFFMKNVYGISVSIAQTIRGNAPFFNTNVVNIDDFQYFGIQYQNQSSYDATSLNNAFVPLQLSVKKSKPSDIASLTVAPFLVPATDDIVDPDGDAVNPISITETKTGSVTVEWYDKITDKPLTSTQLNQTFCVLSATDVSPYIKVSGVLI